MGQQAVIPGRAVSEFKHLHGAVRDAAPAQIISDERALVAGQRLLEEQPGRVVDFKQLACDAAGFFVVGGQRDADAGGQNLKRIPEFNPFLLHYEGEGVAALGAGSEAAPRLPVRENEEGRGAFLMKRTVGLQGTAGPLQVDVAGYDLDDVQPAFYVVNLRHSGQEEPGH